MGANEATPKDGDGRLNAVRVSRTEEVGCWRAIMELLEIGYLEGGTWGRKRIEGHGSDE